MAGIPGDLLKEAAAAGKSAAKGSERSYMGQLHSGLTKAGESMGMSHNVSKYVAGIGMVGAGIGAFNIANNTSENHPFIGGAMKVGIIAGAGYAALKGHNGELEAMAKNPLSKFKPKAEHYNPGGASVPFTPGKLYQNEDSMVAANTKPEFKREPGNIGARAGSMNTFHPKSEGKAPEGSAKVGRSGYSTSPMSPASAGTAPASGGQGAFDFNAPPPNASGVSAAAGAVENSSVVPGAAAPHVAEPEKNPTHGTSTPSAPPPAENPTHGTASTDAGLHNPAPPPVDTVGTQSVSGPVGESEGEGLRLVSMHTKSKMQRYKHDAELFMREPPGGALATPPQDSLVSFHSGHRGVPGAPMRTVMDTYVQKIFRANEGGQFRYFGIYGELSKEQKETFAWMKKNPFAE